MYNLYPGDGRRRLASSTQAIHKELHHHPLISRILKSDLMLVEYYACLNINYLFFKQIELLRSVKGVFETFSVQQTVLLLESDLAHFKENYEWEGFSPLINDCGNWSKNQILGGLYVAHGSQFGRQIMAKSVARSLPTVPKTYLSHANDNAIWQALKAQLDQAKVDPIAFSQVELGAHQAFTWFKQIADQYAAHLYRVGTGVSP